MADWGPSRPRHPHLEVFADLRPPHESSGARLETDFGYFCEKCERFLNFSNFALKKFKCSGSGFLIKRFLIKSVGCSRVAPPILPLQPAQWIRTLSIKNVEPKG